MKSNYKKIGEYIREVDVRNAADKKENLLGVSVSKVFIKSIANTIGTDFRTYRVVRKSQFTYIPDTSRRGDKIGVALLDNLDEGLVSQAYTVFEIIDKEKLLPEYLMMWFRRPEFDRYARFISHGSVREIFEWEDMCNVALPIPHINKQKEIVKEYNVLVNRIALNNQLIQKLEETAQAIYKHWFVDFEFPDENGDPYKSNGGEMEFNEEFGEVPRGWENKIILDLAYLKYGKMLDSTLFLNKGYPVFSGYGVRGFYTEYMYKEPQILVLCRGVSGTGEVKLSPPFSYVTNLSIIVEAKEYIAKKMYLFYFMKNANLRTLDSGSAQSQITIGDLNYQSILLPSIKVQETFSFLIEKIIAKKKFLTDSLLQLENLKSLLLSKLATIEN